MVELRVRESNEMDGSGEVKDRTLRAYRAAILNYKDRTK